MGDAVALIKGKGKSLRRKEKRARIEQIRASLGLSDSQRTPVVLLHMWLCIELNILFLDCGTFTITMTLCHHVYNPFNYYDTLISPFLNILIQTMET
jgi:hypothetical protein